MSGRLPRWLPWALAAGPACFLAILYLWPFATLLARALDAAGTGALDADVIWFTTWQAVLSTVLTIAVAIPLLVGGTRRAGAEIER